MTGPSDSEWSKPALLEHCAMLEAFLCVLARATPNRRITLALSSVAEIDEHHGRITIREHQGGEAWTLFYSEGD